MKTSKIYNEFLYAESKGFSTIIATYNKYVATCRKNDLQYSELNFLLSTRLWENAINGNEKYQELYDKLLDLSLKKRTY